MSTTAKKLTMAKPDNEDFETVLNFFNASELALESDKYNLFSAEEKWQDLDEDNTDRKRIEKIRKSVARDLGYSIDDIDGRIVMYEFLREKFAAASTAWRRVYWTSSVLLDNIQDPFEDHLQFHPCFEIKHVENEQ